MYLKSKYIRRVAYHEFFDIFENSINGIHDQHSIPLTVDGPVRHPMHASVGSAFRASLFLPASNTAILDAARTVMQPATSKQRTGGRTDSSSVFARAEIPVGLSPCHPVCCSRSTPDIDSDDGAIKSNRPRLLTLIRAYASDVAKTLIWTTVNSKRAIGVWDF